MQRSNFEGKGAAHYKTQTLCHVLFKNCCTNRDAIWDVELGQSRESHIRQGAQLHIGATGEYE